MYIHLLFSHAISRSGNVITQHKSLVYMQITLQLAKNHMITCIHVHTMHTYADHHSELIPDRECVRQ